MPFNDSIFGSSGEKQGHSNENNVLLGFLPGTDNEALAFAWIS